MRPLQFIVGDVTDILDEKMRSASAALKEEVIHFRGKLANAQTQADMQLPDTVQALRQGVPLAELKEQAGAIKIGRENVKIFEKVLSTIIEEIAPMEAPWGKRILRVNGFIEVLTINKQKYLEGMATHDNAAPRFREAFEANLNALMALLNEHDIPVELMRELQDSLEYVEQIQLNHKEAS